MDRIVSFGLNRLSILAAIFPRRARVTLTPGQIPQRLSRAELAGLFAAELGYR